MIRTTPYVHAGSMLLLAESSLKFATDGWGGWWTGLQLVPHSHTPLGVIRESK